MYDSIKVAQVEPYQQQTQHTCSAACLKSVVGHYGFDIGEHELSQYIGVRQRGGAETDQIAQAARQLGFDAFEWSFSSLEQAKTLTDQDIPIIADIQSFKHPGSGHYVVITGIDKDGIHLMDPNTPSNQRTISPQEMEQRWWDRAMKPPHKLMKMWGVVVLPKQTKVESPMQKNAKLKNPLLVAAPVAALGAGAASYLHKRDRITGEEYSHKQRVHNALRDASVAGLLTGGAALALGSLANRSRAKDLLKSQSRRRDKLHGDYDKAMRNLVSESGHDTKRLPWAKIRPGKLKNASIEAFADELQKIASERK